MSVTKLLFISCFVGAALTKSIAEVKTWFMGHAPQCIADYAVNDEELLLLDKYVIPDSRDAKCFLTCVFKKATWMDDKGMFVEENAVAMAEKDHVDEPDKIENAKKLFTTCKSVNDKDYSGQDAECDRGAALAKCFIDNAPKMGFQL